MVEFLPGLMEALTRMPRRVGGTALREGMDTGSHKGLSTVIIQYE
jgi:hypothetical protein